MKKLFLTSLLFSLASSVFASDILVRIYSDKTIRKSQLTCVMGAYSLSDETGKEVIRSK